MVLLDYEQTKKKSVTTFEHEKAWDKNKQFRKEIQRVRKELNEYANLLAEVACVPSLHSQKFSSNGGRNHKTFSKKTLRKSHLRHGLEYTLFIVGIVAGLLGNLLAEFLLAIWYPDGIIPIDKAQTSIGILAQGLIVICVVIAIALYVNRKT